MMAQDGKAYKLMVHCTLVCIHDMQEACRIREM
jgi:hypothetical protein